MTLEIGLHMAVALRLAAKGRARVDPGVVVDLHEGFECDAKLPAVVKHGIVVVGDAPGTRVEVLAPGEAAVLHAAAQLGEGVATAYRPAASTCALVVFQDCRPVSRHCAVRAPRDRRADQRRGRGLLPFFAPAGSLRRSLKSDSAAKQAMSIAWYMAPPPRCLAVVDVGIKVKYRCVWWRLGRPLLPALSGTVGRDAQ